MPAAYQLATTLDLNTVTQSDVWLGADYPTGTTSGKFTLASLKANILAAATGSTNLSATHLSGTVTLASSTGTGATLLAATSGSSGVMLPAHVTKLSHITVTAPINLDSLSTSNHAAASALNASMVVNPTTQAINVQLGAISGQTNRLQLLGNGLYVQSADLGVTYSLSTVNITCAIGSPVSISEATPSQAGIMGNGQAAKLANLTLTTPVNLDTIATQIHQPATALNASLTINGAQQCSVNLGAVSGVTNQLSIQGGGLFVPPTNITAAIASTTITINSSTGLGVLIASATTSNAGVMPAADKTKLNLITATAAVNLDTLSSIAHNPVTVSNASLAVTGQALNVRLSATGGNQIVLNGDGLYVAPAAAGSADRLLGEDDLGSLSGATAINLDTGTSRNKKVNMTANWSPTFTSAIKGDFKLFVRTNGFTITWPGNASFVGGVPTLNTAIFDGVAMYYRGP